MKYENVDSEPKEQMMHTVKFNRVGNLMVGLLLLGGFLALAGCCMHAPKPKLVADLPSEPGHGAQLFATDDEAAKALITAVKARDKESLRTILGPATKELVSGDAIEDANDFDTFVKHANEQTRLEKKTDSLAILHIGVQDWPFAIPLVKVSGPDGKWFFDTEAGKQEILARRIGANELEAINVCRGYVLAQREYASQDRDGSTVLQYAQRFVSKPGQKDGLYWETAAGEQPSPLGPLVAQATEEGYFPKKAPGPQPFHGYYFHILKKQGSDAPGGKYDYVINGHMIAGFALVAWPAQYGNSGVMTLIVNHQGKVYQKDLGPKTAETAKALSRYNPDGMWAVVKE
ncbi:MAG: DUF2950 domain-containing protein [Phycisphaerae bacterium]